MIILMGVPGAGKTTVLQNLKSDYTVLNYGDLMFEIEKEKFSIQHRDEMRKLPVEKQKQVQRLVAERLAKERRRILLDTHCSIATPSGFYPGLPFEFLKMLQVDALVLVTATTEEIRARRAKDASRRRDQDDVELHNSINLGYLSAYSAFSGAPATVIYNSDGKVKEAVAQLQTVLAKY